MGVTLGLFWVTVVSHIFGPFLGHRGLASIWVAKGLSCFSGALNTLGKPVYSKTDEFLANFRRGVGGHFRSKKFVPDIFGLKNGKL